MILREKNMVSSEFMHVADAMTADMLYDAALAYDKAASFYFGEYAKPNFGTGGIYE